MLVADFPSGDSEDLYQIALLIDQLKHDDLQFRINASKSIIQIAKALGPERTRDELIPFLSESVDDDDSVQIIMAEKFGALTAYVGGHEYVHVLLQPLEVLISGEESSLRAKALNSVEEIVEKMNLDQVTKYFEPFLQKLANKDWYTARSSAAELTHLAYAKVNSKAKADYRGLYLRLCKDETPSVRRVAAQNLVKMVKAVASTPNSSTENVLELIDAFKTFSHDDQDSIRIQIIPNCIEMSAFLTSDIKSNHVLPVVLAIASDKSWRVRWSLANRLHEVLGAVDYEPSLVMNNQNNSMNNNSSLPSVFDSLLNDSEPEVRAAAASHLSKVAKHMPKSVIVSKLIPSSQRLVADASEFVRAFFANELNALAPLIGSEETVQHILPMILILLRDDTSEVRLNIISTLDAINEVIGVELLSQSLLPAIVELAEDSKWRVRLAVLEHMPMIAKQLGVAFFNEKLISVSTTWLSDSVYSIRKAAANNITQLASLFGNDWTSEQLLPNIDKMHHNTNFSQRMTALYAIQVLVQAVSPKMLEQYILPITIALANDPVPNVRFTVAKTIQAIYPSLVNGLSTEHRININSSITSINSVLNRLANDTDPDVRFYAEKATSETKPAG